MLTTKAKSRLILRLLGVLLGALLVILLSIPLLGPCWHILYGDSIFYADWKIPVPKGFYVRRSEEGPTMWKESFGIPFFKAPYGHISLFRRQQPFSFERDYLQFRNGLTQDAAERKYEFKAERTVQVGKNPGYCLEFGQSSQRTLLRCTVENSSVVFFYEGDPQYVPEAFSSFRGMSAAADNVTGPNKP